MRRSWRGRGDEVSVTGCVELNEMVQYATCMVRIALHWIRTRPTRTISLYMKGLAELGGILMLFRPSVRHVV